MKLTARLVLVMLIATGALLAVDGYFLIDRARSDFEAGVRSDVNFFGNALAKLVGEMWREKGEDRALAFLDELDQVDGAVQVRWVWLDRSPGEAMAPRASHPEIVGAPPPARKGRPQVDGDAEDPPDTGADANYLYVPVKTGDSRPGALEFEAPLTPLKDYSRTTVIRVLVLSSVLVVIGGVVIVLLGVRLIGRPLDRLMEKVRRAGEGDLSGDLDLRGSHDELGELARAVNSMCASLGEAQERVADETEARIRAVEQLRHADRLKTVGRFASGMAHELGTPLNVMSARAGMIAEGNLPPEDAARNATIIRSQAERMTTLIRQLLSFARPGIPKRVTTDLWEVVRETMALVDNLKFPGRVEFPEDRDPVPACVDPGQIQQVLTNLLVNGLQSMPDGGTVRIDIDRETVTPPPELEAPESEYIRLTVSDEGEGIPEERLPHLFEPFFTTKEVGEGTGLGLSIAHGIIREHNGWIEVSSEVGAGSRFAVHLPTEEAPCTDA